MKGSSKGRDREPPRDSVGPNRRYIEETSVQRKHLRVLRNPTIIHHGKEAPFSGANSFAILTMTKRTRTRMRTSQSRILVHPRRRLGVRLPFSVTAPSALLPGARSLARARARARTRIRVGGESCKSASYTQRYNSGKERLPWIIQRGMDTFFRRYT
jgi:hypothetical protein